MTEHATYLYALVRSDRAPKLAGAPAGLPGMGDLRLIPTGPGVSLVAADAPVLRYGAAPIERGLQDLDWVSRCALAHEEVVRHFARRLTTLPMRLFTLFSTDERARAHVHASAARMSRVLTQVEGCEEWGMRVFVDEPRPHPKWTVATADDAGRKFLEGKREAQRAGRPVAASALRAAGALLRDLKGRARAQRALPIVAPNGRRLLADTAFLVPRADRREFRAAVRAAAEHGRTRGLSVTLNGPWPPYNFAEGKR
jgi:hypothetical protein